MDKKALLVFLTSVLLSTATYGAETEYEDVIHLKDGSVVRGLIVEEVPGETYKIELYGGSMIIFAADDVDRVVREPIGRRDGPKTGPSANGYRSVLFGASFIFGKYGDHGESFYGAEALVSWQLSRFFSPAVGLGYNRAVYEYYNAENLTYNIIPVYLSGRFTYLRTGLVGFYADCYGGYGLVYASGTPGQSGGLMYGVDHGLEFGPRRLRGYVSFGYRRQHHLDRAGGALYVRLGVLM